MITRTWRNRRCGIEERPGAHPDLYAEPLRHCTIEYTRRGATIEYSVKERWVVRLGGINTQAPQQFNIGRSIGPHNDEEMNVSNDRYDVPFTVKRVNTHVIARRDKIEALQTRNTLKDTTPLHMYIFQDQTPIRHLYIHIPFCHRRCSYCDFNTYANMEDRIGAYVDALCAELGTLGEVYAGRWGDNNGGNGLPAKGSLLRSDLRPTIFFGGGTPSMLPLDLLERVLGAADRLVPIASAEVTLEANPGTVLGRDYLRGLRDIGVNRLSMGVQSLHDPTLRMLGRIHTAAEAQRSYEDARAAGFDNINLDFIFGLPHQTVEQWAWTLDQITTWDTDHFSLYSLILEEGTPLHAQVIGNRLAVPDDDETGEMYELAMDRFGAAGYVQYEISNWAKTREPSSSRVAIPFYACHHNLAYWLNADYGAAGAGAHGHVFPQRYADILGIDDYIKGMRSGKRPVAEVTELSDTDLRAETIFMGLRLNIGVGLDHFRDRCGVDIDTAYGPTIDELVALGLIERDEVAVRLTPRGRMLGNQVFMRFV